MKKIMYSAVLFAATFLFVTVSCKKEEPDPEPQITVGFKYSPDSPVAGETVSFTNASTGGTSWAWDFGDGNSATEKNPTHVYTASGTYSIILKVNDKSDLTFSKDITVTDPAPMISFSPSSVESGRPITFTADIYNPDNASVEYVWQFPADNTKGESVDESGVATGESVTASFINAAPDTKVSVTAKIGGKELTSETSFEVLAQLAATLYLGEKDGNIWSKKLYTEGEAELLDFGISSGAHPLTMAYSDQKLYVFNAGDYVAYTTEIEQQAGQIFSVSPDGSNYVTHLTFGVESAYDDAFFGDVVDGTIYFTDRRNDVTAIPTTTENAEWGENGGDANPEAFPALVANNQLGYYSAFRGDGGPTYGWGALNGRFTKHNGTYWWAKNANHKGIWRFEDSDIGTVDVVPAAGGILTDYAVRSFAIDDVNQKIYFSSNNGLERGFFVADIDGSNVVMIDNSPYDGEGGENEPTYITGIAVDNETGYVYWAYRAPAEVDVEVYPLAKSGIKRYSLSGEGEVEFFIEDVEAYGITIDHEKT